MKFRYIFRNGAGPKQEGEIEAKSRDDAFAELRAQGIRPIKMFSLNGTKANGEEKLFARKRVITCAIVFGLLAGLGLAAWLHRTDFRSEEVRELEQAAYKLIATHKNMVATLHLDALRDYQKVLHQSPDTAIDQRVILGLRDIDDARKEIRDLFLDALEKVNPNHEKVRGEINKLYHQSMDAVDLEQVRIVNDAKAFRLLESNRGKWSVNSGRIEWKDERLADEFAGCSRDLIPAN